MVQTAVDLIHILAAATWLGGMIYIAFILQPALRTIDPQQNARLSAAVQKRFSITSWVAMAVLIITGYMKTPEGMMFDLSISLGQILAVKHLLIIMVILIGLGIALYAGPGMRKNAPKPGEPPSADFFRFHKSLNIMALTNLILGIGIFVCAMLLR